VALESGLPTIADALETLRFLRAQQHRLEMIAASGGVPSRREADGTLSQPLTWSSPEPAACRPRPGTCNGSGASCSRLHQRPDHLFVSDDAAVPPEASAG